MLKFNECNINIITFYHISKVLREKKKCNYSCKGGFEM